MRYLVDTNVLVRIANAADPFHATAARAVFELHRQGESLHIASQMLIEFRNVATRPTSVNGLGMSLQDAERNAARFEAGFGFLVDTPDIFPAWKAIVTALGIIGKRVHDARVVAICQVHAVSHLLTFNCQHFTAMSQLGAGLSIVDPASV